MQKKKLAKSKLEGYSGEFKKDKKFSIIVRVSKADYMPDPLTLRTKISPFVFTADATAETIESLEKDKFVLSVSISDTLPMID